MKDLGALTGNDSSEARGINNHGQVVGQSYTSGQLGGLAFIYADGMLTDLNQLVDGSGAEWILERANAINDLGQIVGVGRIGDERHAFLLTPIPEPTTCVLAVIGAIGLLAFRRKG